MWQITSALIADRLSELRAEAEHQRLVGVARRARKARRLARKVAPAEPTHRPATHGAEPSPVRVPQQRSAEFERANR
jgi:hypothetical protein